jgi:hypothetical protein
MLTLHPKCGRHTFIGSIGLVTAIVLGATAVPAAAAPAQPATARPATVQASAYQLDLGTRRDFVAQANLVQCVGASVQIMINMMRREPDRTAATQLRYQQMARKSSGPRIGGGERRGASVWGWATTLSRLGAGHYEVVGAKSIHEALLIAAKAMRTTGRPAGLLMWRGRHAWVMSGFRSTRDPLVPGARVTSVIVEDPLYPLDSDTWGASPAPGSRLSVAALGQQFVPRRQSNRSPQLSGKYVVVIPFRHHFHDLL